MSKREFYIGIVSKAGKKNFVKVFIENDGSFYLVFLRERKHTGGWLYSSENNEVSEYQTEEKKPVRISYHTTGRINYHETQLQSRFCEPLVDLKERVDVLIYSMPSVDKLDPLADEDSEYLLDFTNHEHRLSILFSILPPDKFNHGNIGFLINNLYVLQLEVVHFNEVPHAEAFVVAMPSIGRSGQAMDKHSAFIEYHKKISNFKGGILYEPDGRGEYMYVFNIAKRAPPKVIIELEDQTLGFEVTHVNEARAKFYVKNLRGQKVCNIVKIISIELDSRL